MVATKPGLMVLDPTAPPMPVDAKKAKRPDTLNGKVIGLLDNHKRNATPLLEELEKLLSERYEFARVVRASKNDVSRPCPEGTVEQLASQCDLVITAIGD